MSLSTSLKQRLVGTWLGNALVGLRELLSLRVLLGKPEQGGMVAQEIIVRRLLGGLCEPGRAFLDVGAHVGMCIAEFRRGQPDGRVVAVEAEPDKAAALQRRFPDVTVHACAAGESVGEVRLYVNASRPGFTSLSAGHASSDDVTEVSVPLRPLDDMLPDTLDVGLIKIDVEGAELGVLRGGAGLVQRCRPVILFESALGAGGDLGYSPEAVFAWFADHDYHVLVPNRVAHDGPALDAVGFVEAHHYPRRSLNFFAVPAEHRESVRDRARRILHVAVRDRD